MVARLTASVFSASSITADKIAAGAMGLRNKLLNAMGHVNQRAYVSGTATGAANQYTLDRWRVVTSGQALTFSASGLGFQLTAPAGGLEQVIEGSMIEGGTYVLSWTGTATATVNGSALANGATIALAAGLQTTIRFTGGTVLNPQFELGSAPSLFDFRDPGAELWRCQRYYEVGVARVDASVSSTGSYASYRQPFKNTKRAVPAVTSTLNTSNVLSSRATDNPSVESFRLLAQSNGAGLMVCDVNYVADAEL